MPDLKVKVSLGSFNIELEGSSEDVISQFNEIKESGLGKIVDQLTPKIIQLSGTKPKDCLQISQPGEYEELPVETDNDSTQIEANLLSLNDLAIKDLPCGETEWVLIYGYYSTQEANKQTFTRLDINSGYKTSNRSTDTRMKNLSGSIKGAIKKNWFRSLNNTD